MLACAALQPRLGLYTDLLNMSLAFPLHPSASVYTRETCRSESYAPSARLQGARDGKRDKHTIRDKGMEKVEEREQEYGLEKKATQRESCEHDGEKERRGTIA